MSNDCDSEPGRCLQLSDSQQLGAPLSRGKKRLPTGELKWKFLKFKTCEPIWTISNQATLETLRLIRSVLKLMAASHLPVYFCFSPRSAIIDL